MPVRGSGRQEACYAPGDVNGRSVYFVSCFPPPRMRVPISTGESPSYPRLKK